MPLLTVVVVLLIVGVLLWALNQAPFIDAGMKKVIWVVVIVVVCLWLLSLFVPGVSLSTLRVGR